MTQSEPKRQNRPGQRQERPGQSQNRFSYVPSQDQSGTPQPPSQNRGFQNRKENQTPRDFKNAQGSQFNPNRPGGADRPKVSLSSQQKEKMDKIDARLKEIGDLKHPDQQELEDKKAAIQKEIDNFNFLRKSNTDEIEKIKQRQKDSIHSISPQENQLVEKNTAKGTLTRKINKAKNQRKALVDEVKILFDQKKEMSTKMPIKNLDDGLEQIAEIDNKIETQTMSNSQLKSLLTQKERIEKNLTKMDGLKSLNESISEKRQEIAQLTDEINQLHAERQSLDEEIQHVEKELVPVHKEKSTLEDEIKSLNEKNTQITEEINKCYGRRDQAIADFRAVRQTYFDLRKEKNDLHAQKHDIYQEAERIIPLQENQQKELDKITLQKNPYETKIKAGKVLIAYLEEIRETQGAPSEEPPTKKAPQGAKNKAAADLIAMVRGTPKSKKSGRRANPTLISITHSIDTIHNFSEFDMQPPKTFEEIDEYITKISGIVNELENSWVNLQLKIDVQDNGKVIVRVLVE